MIRENIEKIRESIALAARKSGREAKDILLVAATKTNSGDSVREAIAAGVDACGENRAQELLEKFGQGAYEGAPLHFIGHLQRNKVKQLVGKVRLIQSVDSERLAEEIDRCAAERGLVQDILLEVNIGGEEAKSGVAPGELEALVKAVSRMEHVRVRGLMTITPLLDAPGANRPYFAQMRQLFLDIRDKKYDNVRMDYLSMGMSADYACAIEEGANMIRVGSAIFGERTYA